MEYSSRMKSYVFGFLLSFALCIGAFPGKLSAEPVYNPEILAGPEFDFRKTTWDMTLNQVKKSEKRRVAEEGVYQEPEGYDSYYVAYTNVSCAGSKGYLIYNFYDDKLFSGTFLFFTKQDISEALLEACISSLGSYDAKRISKPYGNAEVWYWDQGTTKVYLFSEPEKDEDDEYHSRLEFYTASSIKGEKYPED